MQRKDMRYTSKRVGDYYGVTTSGNPLLNMIYIFQILLAVMIFHYQMSELFQSGLLGNRESINQVEVKMNIFTVIRLVTTLSVSPPSRYLE